MPTRKTPAASKKSPRTTKNSDTAKSAKSPRSEKKLTGRARLLSSKTVYKGKVFWVTSDEVVEPGGIRVRRDVVRHNGSVVILAIDDRKNPDDPEVLLIRQYRHAAGQFLLELPAGRIEPGEKLMPAAKRELLEETGYKARKWSRLVQYYASPGFVAESMDILLAEDLVHAVLARAPLVGQDRLLRRPGPGQDLLGQGRSVVGEVTLVTDERDLPVESF